MENVLRLRTTGTRINARLFGGWDLRPDESAQLRVVECCRALLLEIGHRRLARSSMSFVTFTSWISSKYSCSLRTWYG